MKEGEGIKNIRKEL